MLCQVIKSLHCLETIIPFVICILCRYSNNFNISVEIDPHSCNSTSEDLHVCSEFSSLTDECHFLNIVSCTVKIGKFCLQLNILMYTKIITLP